MFASLGLNIMLCAELLLTMRDPFYPAERRMKFYVLFAILFSTIFPFLTIGRGLSINYEATRKVPADPNAIPLVHEHEELINRNVNTVFESSFTVCLISVFFIFAIYSSVQALRLTTRPGISREMRKHFAYSHIIYIIVYITSWMVYYFASYYLMFYVALFGNNF